MSIQYFASKSLLFFPIDGKTQTPSSSLSFTRAYARERRWDVGSTVCIHSNSCKSYQSSASSSVSFFFEADDLEALQDLECLSNHFVSKRILNLLFYQKRMRWRQEKWLDTKDKSLSTNQAFFARKKLSRDKVKCLIKCLWDFSSMKGLVLDNLWGRNQRYQVLDPFIYINYIPNRFIICGKK